MKYVNVKCWTWTYLWSWIFRLPYLLFSLGAIGGFLSFFLIDIVWFGGTYSLEFSVLCKLFCWSVDLDAKETCECFLSDESFLSVLILSKVLVLESLLLMTALFIGLFLKGLSSLLNPPPTDGF